VQAEKVPPIYEKSGAGVFRKGADRELAKMTKMPVSGWQRSDSQFENLVWTHVMRMIEYLNANHSKSGIDRKRERSYRENSD
jgi:hypothetical protein